MFCWFLFLLSGSSRIILESKLQPEFSVFHIQVVLPVFLITWSILFPAFLGYDEYVDVLESVLLNFCHFFCWYLIDLSSKTWELCFISSRMASTLISTLSVQKELQVEVENIAHSKIFYWDFDWYLNRKLRYIWGNLTSL